MSLASVNAGSRLIVAALVALVLSIPVARAQSGSSTFQIDAAHDGLINFSTPFAPPLKKRWVVDLGGPISYPVVAGKLVVVITSGAVGTRLVAFDAANGKIAWQKIISGSSPYIAANDTTIFLITFDGPLQAFRAADGLSLWSTQLSGQSFFNFLPIVADGYVFVAGDGVGTTVYAVNQTTGKVAWQNVLAAGGAGATFGDGQLFFSIPCDVASYKPTTGKLLWNYSSGCDGGGGAIALYHDGRVFAPDVNLGGGIVLNAANGKVIGSLAATAPAFAGTSIYYISANSLVSSDIVTGNLNWYFTPKPTLSGPPIVINGNVYILSANGLLYVNKGTTGRVLQVINIGLGSQQQSGSFGYSGLGAGQGMLFVPSGSLLAAFSP